MQYERLVREAWQLTWRLRVLWVLGFFAGGASAPSCAWGGGGGRPDGAPQPSEIRPRSPELEMAAEDAARWVSENLALIVSVAILLAVVVLAAFVVSFIAQGAMARAGAEGAAGRTPTFREAWSAGLRLFWRYVRLTLVLLAAVIGVAVAVGVGAAILSALANQGGIWFPVATLVAGISLLAILVALAVAFGIIVPFAQRAVAIEDIGALAALRAGWALLRANVGTSLVVWVLSIVVSVAVAIALGIAAIVVLLVGGLVGFVLWTVAGWSALTTGYVALAVVAVLAALIVVAAILNTFFWHYWTIAYLRLAHPAAPSVGVPPGVP